MEEVGRTVLTYDIRVHYHRDSVYKTDEIRPTELGGPLMTDGFLN